MTPPIMVRIRHLYKKCVGLLLVGLAFAVFNQISSVILQPKTASRQKRHTGIPAAHNELDPFYQIGGSNIYLYSAYIDLRYDHATVRMFGMQQKREVGIMKCRLVDNEDVKIKLSVHKIEPIYPIWPSDKLKYYAYIYHYRIEEQPDNTKIKESDWVVNCRVDNAGQSTTIPARVLPASEYNNNHDKPRLAVCVKAVYGTVNDTRLIEWIEFNKVLGVEKFIFYNAAVIGPATHVFKHYQEQGDADMLQFTYLLRMQTLMQDDPLRSQLLYESMLLEQGYLVSINDCLYRHAHLYSHILLLDLDEIIVPHGDKMVTELIQRAEQYHKGYAAYIFETAWHYETFGVSNPEFPVHLHTQRFGRRTPPMKSQPKSILKPQCIISINWHGITQKCDDPMIAGNFYLLPDEYGFLHHFRAQCKHFPQKCVQLQAKYEKDKVLKNYAKDLEERVSNVLSVLKRTN